MDSHSNSIRIEGAGGGIVLKTTEEIVVSDSIELRVALEAVERTSSFNCVGALKIEVIGEENLLRVVKLAVAIKKTNRNLDLER